MIRFFCFVLFKRLSGILIYNSLGLPVYLPGTWSKNNWIFKCYFIDCSFQLAVASLCIIFLFKSQHMQCKFQWYSCGFRFCVYFAIEYFATTFEEAKTIRQKMEIVWQLVSWKIINQFVNTFYYILVGKTQQPTANSEQNLSCIFTSFGMRNMSDAAFLVVLVAAGFPVFLCLPSSSS